MDKTVENIKKFLHISPKKKKNDAKVAASNGAYLIFLLFIALDIVVFIKNDTIS